MLQDVRYALRGFRRNPVLTGAIVLTLAFGIGMNTGVFSVIAGMVFRARVEKDPASFFQVLPETPEGARLFGSTVAEFRQYRERVPHAVQLSAWAVGGARVNDDARPSLAMLVSCDFFALYGLERAKLGSLFSEQDCAAPTPIVVLSEEIWRGRFFANPALPGTSIQLNGRPFTVAGIVPARFSGRLRGPGIWVPYTMQAPFYHGVDLFSEHAPAWLTVEGRVRPGGSFVQVRMELEAAAPHKVTLTNGSLIEMPGVRAMALWVTPLITAALGLILLLACTNVTMLMLSRAAARRYEMGVRLALGASRWRLLRMAGTEGVLLALFAGGIAAFVAGLVPAGIESLVPGMPHYPMQPDWIVFSYLAGITLLAGGIAGLTPAAESLRTDLIGSIKHARWRLRDLLIAAQVAMSMVLLVGAALFVRTEYRLFRADPGFDARHVMLGQLPAVPFGEIERELRALPAVQSVAFADALPYGRPQGVDVRVAGGAFTAAVVTAISPGFFAALGIPLEGGRELRLDDRRGVVVPRSFAERFWKGENPLGRQFETADGAHWQVLGVTPDTDLERHGTGAGPRFYRLAEAAPRARVLLVRFEGDATEAARDIRSVFRRLALEERELPRTLEADLAELASRFRATVAAALFLGGSAFLLAVIGVYGVIAFAVSRRMKEMGIRLALGATRTHIVRAVLASGVRPVGAGLAVGAPLALAAALALSRAFRDTPAPIAAWDGYAFTGVAVLISLAAAIAMLKPAWKASACDPASTLKDE